MTLSRYSHTSRINLGHQLGTPENVLKLRTGIKDGTVPIVKTLIMTGADRLDTIAGSLYGDSRYWWILAAASGIGWGMQVPAGTVINVIRLSDVEALVG